MFLAFTFPPALILQIRIIDIIGYVINLTIG